MDDRIQSSLWVGAEIRLANSRGTPMMVVRRGEAQSGVILVKINRLDGTATVLSQTRTPDGRLAWLRATGPDPVPEADADSYIDRQIRYDPDLWVLELEDRTGRIPFGEPIL